MLALKEPRLALPSFHSARSSHRVDAQHVLPSALHGVQDELPSALASFHVLSSALHGVHDELPSALASFH